MNSDPVWIDDDDVEMGHVEILDEDDKITNEKPDDKTPDEIIVLDDEPPSKDTHSEIISEHNYSAVIYDKKERKSKKSEKSFINNLKTNILMDTLVTKCSSMDNAVGMPRVIQKTLLPLYRDADNKLKESSLFRKVLKRTLKLLERDPDHKFLHIKSLCEQLKCGRMRRNVPFVTLATKLNHNGARSPRELISSSKPIKIRDVNKQQENSTDNTESAYEKSIKDTANNVNIEENNRFEKNQGTEEINIIANVNSQATEESSAIGTDITHNIENISTVVTDNNYQTRVINENNDPTNNNNKTVIKDHYTVIHKSNESSTCNIDSGKEKTNVILANYEMESVINLDNDSGNEVIIIDENTTSADEGHKNPNKENNSLRPGNDKLSDNHVQSGSLMGPDTVPKAHSIYQVLQIEKDIALYKKTIADLEVAEVTKDNECSPYILCSKLKRKIVECYKKLRAIHGKSTSLVKRCKMRLRVLPGHPPGPAKRLEQFLNNSVDKNGTIAFPDFSDVAKCVIEASIADNLGWSKDQVFLESASLFRQCGQALRKQRQSREYRDLMSLVRDNQHDDPAEHDPDLLAKLEQNKAIATAKEKEIIDRFVYMERLKIPAHVAMCLQSGNIVNQDQDQGFSDAGDSELDETHRNMLVVHVPPATNNQYEIGESSNNNDSIYCDRGNDGKTSVVNGPASLHDIQSKIYMNNQGNNLPVSQIGDPGVPVKFEENQNQNMSEDQDQEVENIDPSVNKPDDGKVEIEVFIKKEPEETVQSMLDELGDSFVSTVFDIEDPFLVTEISSDESSEEDS